MHGYLVKIRKVLLGLHGGYGTVSSRSHNLTQALLAQIAGSMGVAGLIAYGLLLRDRIALLWRCFDRTVAVFAMCYGGMLLISMTNPGEFCPFPYEMIVVMLFTVVEYSAETGKPQQPE